MLRIMVSKTTRYRKFSMEEIDRPKISFLLSPYSFDNHTKLESVGSEETETTVPVLG